jgi:hypothetical protein
MRKFRVIRLTLSGIASRVGFTYEEIEDIKIAVKKLVRTLSIMPIKGLTMLECIKDA